MSRRYSLPALLTRQFAADAVPLLALVGTVVLLAGLVAALPLATERTGADEIGYRLAQLTPSQRDLTVTANGGAPVTLGDTDAAVFAPTVDGLAKVLAATAQPLRSRLSAAQFITMTDRVPAQTPHRASDPELDVTFAAAPGLADRLKVIDGAAPAAFASATPTGPPIEMMLSRENAESLRWRVGETRRIDTGVAGELPVTLSGTFVARSPDDPYWRLDRSALTPERITQQNGTEIRRLKVSTAVIDASSWPELTAMFFQDTTSIRIPFSDAALSSAEAARLLPQLRQFTGTGQTLATPNGGGTLTVVRFGSAADDAIAVALDRGATAAALLLLVVFGPLGVAGAVLWLLTKLIVQRRREAILLARARGASGGQLAATLAAETLILTVPAAAFGAAIAFALGGFAPGLLAAPAAVALVPGLFMLVVPVTGWLRTGRTDLDPRSHPWIRVVLELLTIGLTALAVVLLLRRGLTTATTLGFDPLLSATPLLLAVSTAVVASRLFPLPLTAIGRRLARGRGIVGHLGSARAIRDPLAGLSPVLAMVVGLSLAVFSGILVGTLQHGVETAGVSAVGADLRVSGVSLDDATLKRIRGVSGVADAVAVYQVSNPADARQDGVPLEASVVVADTARLRRVQADLGNPMAIPSGMDRTHAGAVPVVVSPDIRHHGSGLSIDDTRLRAVGTVPDTALSTADPWILVDRAQAAAIGVTVFRPALALVRLDPGSRPAAVENGIRAIVGEAAFTTPARAADRFRTSPAASGLQLLLTIVIVVVGLLCAGTILLALLVAARSRERLLALLRTLGMSRRQARGLISWEVWPSAIVAMVAGLLLGLVLPIVVLGAVDLTPFTGGTIQPALSFDPPVLLALVGGFLVIVVGAAALAVTTARRIDIARSLRTSAEG